MSSPAKPKREVTPAQIRRAQVTSVISQVLFAGWLVANMTKVHLPELIQSQWFWLIIGIPFIMISWPVMRNPEASKKMQTPFMRLLNLGVAGLMIAYFVVDHSHWGFGLLGAFIIFSEWLSWRTARKGNAQRPEEA